MSEPWQNCPSCSGAGGKAEEVAALYNEPGFDHPQIRTASQWVSCNTCLGTGRVQGGSR